VSFLSRTVSDRLMIAQRAGSTLMVAFGTLGDLQERP
jgi:hypothetical protein